MSVGKKTEELSAWKDRVSDLPIADQIDVLPDTKLRGKLR